MLLAVVVILFATIAGGLAQACDPNDLGQVQNETDSSCPDDSVGSAEISHGVVCYNGTIPGSEAVYIADDGCALMPYGIEGKRTCTNGSGEWLGDDDVTIGLTLWQLVLNVVGGPLWVAGIIMTVIVLYQRKCCIRGWYNALTSINYVIHTHAIGYWIAGVVISVTSCEDATRWVAVGFSLSCLSLIYSVAVLIFFNTIGKKQKKPGELPEGTQMFEKEIKS